MNEEEQIKRIKARAEKALRKGQTIEDKHCRLYEIVSVKIVGKQYAITFEMTDTRAGFHTFKNTHYFDHI